MTRIFRFLYLITENSLENSNGLVVYLNFSVELIDEQKLFEFLGCCTQKENGNLILSLSCLSISGTCGGMTLMTLKLKLN